MNDTKAYDRGRVIFREGDPGDCMYEIENGRVGIYRDYGGPDEQMIDDLYGGKVFGEMGLLDHAPRTATVVVLEDQTILTRVSEGNFNAWFAENPMQVLNVMQQMCNRLRKTTKEYVEACHTVYDEVETKRRGEEKSLSLLDRINELCDYYSGVSIYPFF